MHCSVIQVYLGSKLSSFGNCCLQAPACYIRDFFTLNVYSLSKICPSPRCISADNVVYRGTDVFGTKTNLERKMSDKMLNQVSFITPPVNTYNNKLLPLVGQFFLITKRINEFMDLRT
jgi:hypothetical protein